MGEFFTSFLASGLLIPRTDCDLWTPELFWLHILSDSLIALAYYSIPIALVYFIQKRRDLPFNWLFLLFGTFSISCGTTHLMEVWALIFPTYWLSSLLRVLTSGVLVYTTAVMLSLLPRVLELLNSLQIERVSYKREAGDLHKSRPSQYLDSKETELRQTSQQLQSEIAKRISDEQALRTANRTLQTLIQSSPLAIATINTDGNVMIWNPAAEKLFGWSEQEVIGGPLPIIPQGKQQEVLAIIQSELKGEEQTGIELCRQRKDGSLVDVSLWTAPLFDDNGVVISTMGLFVDISDRKALERELALRQARFDAFFTAAPAGLAILDDQLRFVHINETLAEINGCAVAEHLGKTLSEIVPQVGQNLEPELQRILSVGEAILRETSGQTASQPGIERHWLTSHFPLPGPDGSPSGIGSVVIEITDRKRVEEALRASETQYRRLIETAAEGIWMLDAQGNTTFANAKIAEMLGYTVEEMAGMHLFAFMDAEGQAIAAQNMERRRQGINEQHDFKFCCKDGSELWALMSTAAILDDTGQYLGALGMVTDITARRMAEEEKQKLIAIIDNSSDFIGVATLEGQPLFINEAGQKLVGIEGIEAVKQTTTDEYFMPEDLAEMRERILHTVMEQGCWEGEFRFRHFKTNMPIPVYYSLFAIKDRQTGQPVALATITRDITERKRAEEELRHSEARFREVATREALLNRLASQIRASLDFNTIMATAVQEIRNLLQLDRCVFVWYRRDVEQPFWEIFQEAKNPALHSLLGFQASAEEIAPLTAKILNMQMIRVNDVSAWSHRVEQQFFHSIGYSAMLVLPVHTQSGAIGAISCSHTNQPRQWSDVEVELLQAVAAQIAIAIDQAQLYKQSRTAAKVAQVKAQQLEQALGELQQTQAQLIQSEKMSSLGQLVAGVAHEINNPVNFIHGNLAHANQYAEDLLNLVQVYQECYPNPPQHIQAIAAEMDLDFIKEDLPKILSSMKIGTDRIRQIVLSLRNFSRLDEAEMKQVDIHAGIDSSLLLLQNRLKAKPNHPAIQVIKEYSQLPLVECYAGQLNQVFMNILTNAIDALDELKFDGLEDSQPINPTIRIHTEVLERYRVLIRIADNGPGMAESICRRLFDPFFTTKPVGQGTGLGMSISYQIVEKHGGQLSCISALGKGAEFFIEIPINQQAK